MTLRERLLKALEFDATRYPPFSWVGLVNKLRTASYAYKMGIEEEIKRRKPLDLALADVVEALERAGVDMGNAAASNVRFRIQALERIDNAIAKLEGVLKEMGK